MVRWYIISNYGASTIIMVRQRWDGAKRSSPGVVRLGPPRIAATVIVTAGGQGAGSSSASGERVVPV
jgi:hypothetical protein